MIVFPLLKRGFTIEYIGNNPISLILEYWTSSDNQDLIDRSSEWLVNEEIEIEHKINEPIHYDGKTLMPRSLDFNRIKEREKRGIT